MPISYYIKVIIALAAVLGGLVVILKVSKKAYNQKFAGDIKVIDRAAVDNGVSVVMIQVKDTKYLLGVGGKDVKLLKEIPE